MEIIGIAADHGGYELKCGLIEYLRQNGFQYIDFGTSGPESVDYPDYGVKVAEAVSKGELSRGILVCSTGIGMSIVANRFPNVRGALCNEVYTAKLSREHNDSNILILGSLVVGKGVAMEIVKAWLTAEFQGGRHERRLRKIAEIEGNLNRNLK